MTINKLTSDFGDSRRTAGPKGPWGLSVYADEIYAPEAGLEPGLALLSRFGIKHTDLRVVNGYDNFVRLTNDEIDSIGRLLKKYDISVWALETPVFKCPLRESGPLNWAYCPGFSYDLTFMDHLWYLSRAFEIAERLGAAHVRCFAFWREYDLGEVFDEAVEKLSIAAKRAEIAGQRLYLQNQQDTLAGTGVELARILKAVNSPHLAGAYDLANSARRAGVPYPDDYRALRGSLGDVHVKFQAIEVRSGCVSPQQRSFSDPKLGYAPYTFWLQPNLPITGWVQIGDKRFDIEGPRTFLKIEETVGIDYRSFFRELKKDGYDGLISVDTSYYIRGAGATSNGEVEASFAKTVPSLKKLIADVCS